MKLWSSLLLSLFFLLSPSLSFQFLDPPLGLLEGEEEVKVIITFSSTPPSGIPGMRIEPINAIITTVKKDELPKLLNYKGVLGVFLDRKIQMLPEVKLSSAFPLLYQSAGEIYAPQARGRFGVNGSGIVIAILDSGIDSEHPDLRGKVIGERDFTGTNDTKDYLGHGTAVASIIAGSGEASFKIVDTSSTNVSGLLNLPSSEFPHHVGATYFNTFGLEGTYWVLVVDPNPDNATNYSLAFLDKDGDFSTLLDQVNASVGERLNSSYYLVSEIDSSGMNVTFCLDINWDYACDVMTGIAPGAKLLNVKVMDEYGYGTISSVVEGILWAIEQNASIITMSLSIKQICTPYHPIVLAIEEALENNITVVAAVGNLGYFMNSLNVLLPACSRAIAVGCSVGDQICWFSSRGPTLHGEIKPELLAPGIVVAAKPPQIPVELRVDENYQWFIGTSASAPHVSGVIALMLELNPHLSPDQIKAILMNTAQDLELPINMQGAGKVNASKACEAVVNGSYISPSVWSIGFTKAGETVSGLFNATELNITSVRVEVLTFELNNTFKGQVSEDSSFTGSFTVPAHVGVLKVRVWWNETMQLYLTLTSPLNESYHSLTLSPLPQEEIIIAHPAEGNWSFNVTPFYLDKTIDVEVEIYFGNFNAWDNASSDVLMPNVIDVSINVPTQGNWEGKIVVNEETIIPFYLRAAQGASVSYGRSIIDYLDIKTDEWRYHHLNLNDTAYLLFSSNWTPSLAIEPIILLFHPDGDISAYVPDTLPTHVKNLTADTYYIGSYVFALEWYAINFSVEIDLPRFSAGPALEAFLFPNESINYSLSLSNSLGVPTNFTIRRVELEYDSTFAEEVSSDIISYSYFFPTEGSECMRGRLEWKKNATFSIHIFDDLGLIGFLHTNDSYCYRSTYGWACLPNQVIALPNELSTSFSLCFPRPTEGVEIKVKPKGFEEGGKYWLHLWKGNMSEEIGSGNISEDLVLNLSIPAPPQGGGITLLAIFNWSSSSQSDETLPIPFSITMLNAPVEGYLLIPYLFYSAHEEVEIDIKLNNFKNWNVNLSLSLSLIDPTGSNLSIYNQSLAMEPEQRLYQLVRWNTTTSPPGIYEVLLELSQQHQAQNYSYHYLDLFEIVETPLMEVSPQQLVLSLARGERSIRNLTILNVGNVNLTGNASVSGNIAPYVSINVTSFDVEVGGKLSLPIEFNARETGEFAGSLDVRTNAGNFSVALAMVVTLPPAAPAAPAAPPPAAPLPPPVKLKRASHSWITMVEGIIYEWKLDRELFELALREMKIEVRKAVAVPKITVERLSEEKVEEKVRKELGVRVYEYLLITHENIEDEHVSNISFIFEVKKEWLKENEINPLDIRLWRYEKGWERLKTEMIGEEGEVYIYKADSPGLSLYAIGETRPVCGDGVCEKGENYTTCPLDCKPVCPPCPKPTEWGDCIEGIQTRIIYRCDETTNYTCIAEEEKRECEVRIGEEVVEETKAICGNGICEANENWENCCIDCGCPTNYTCKENKCIAQAWCGDGTCSPEIGENMWSCPTDCAPAPLTSLFLLVQRKEITLISLLLFFSLLIAVALKKRMGRKRKRRKRR